MGHCHLNYMSLWIAKMSNQVGCEELGAFCPQDCFVPWALLVCCRAELGRWSMYCKKAHLEKVAWNSLLNSFL